MHWLEIGLKLMPLVVGAVEAVEKLFTSEKGKAKQDAAVTMVMAWLGVAEGAAGRDLLKDPEVDKAVRAAIDSIVAAQNAIAAAKVAVNIGA